MSDINKTTQPENCFFEPIFKIKFFVKIGDWGQSVAKKTHHLGTVCLNLRPTPLSFSLSTLFYIMSLGEKEGLALEFGNTLFLRINNGIPCR